MQFEDILYEKRGNAAWITINRPRVYNAFRNQTLDELATAFEDAGADDTLAAVVFTGAGGKSFCTGGDVKVENNFTPSRGREHHRKLMRLAIAMRNCPKPVIAAIRGYCIGGGNELNLLSDVSIATEESKFGQAGPKMGSTPLWWGTQLLPGLVGDKRAREIVYWCRQYTAQEALDMGWINKVVPDGELEAEVQRWVDELLERSPQAIRIAKLSLNYNSDQLFASVNHGSTLLTLMQGTEEFHEGTSAFVEKRKADWSKFRRNEE